MGVLAPNAGAVASAGAAARIAADEGGRHHRVHHVRHRAGARGRRIHRPAGRPVRSPDRLSRHRPRGLGRPQRRVRRHHPRQPAGGGDPLELYCIDILTHTWGGLGYKLGTWDASTVANVGYVARILNEYFPNVPTEPAGLGSDNERAAATQAAIWFFSDRYVLKDGRPAPADRGRHHREDHRRGSPRRTAAAVADDHAVHRDWCHRLDRRTVHGQRRRRHDPGGGVGRRGHVLRRRRHPADRAGRHGAAGRADIPETHDRGDRQPRRHRGRRGADGQRVPLRR